MKVSREISYRWPLWWIHVAVIGLAAWVIIVRFLSLFPLSGYAAPVVDGLAKLLHPFDWRFLSVLSECVVIGGHEVHLTLLCRPEILTATIICFFIVRVSNVKSTIRLIVAMAASFALYCALTLWIGTHDLSRVLDATWWRAGAAAAFLGMTWILSGSPPAREYRTSQLGWTYGTAVAGLFMLGLLGWVSRPEPKNGVIWIDETHGNWEPVTGVIDTASYGRHTQYNYVLLRQWLERVHTVRVLSDSLPDSLDCDLLLIKIPTRRYTEKESETIRRFVARGGALLIIGDHTNLFGSTLVGNELLQPYGLEFRSDATIPFRGREYRHVFAWWNSSMGLSRFGNMDFQTSCSIRSANLGAVPLVLAGDVVTEKAVYSNDRFFGDLKITPDDQRAPLALSACVRYKKGLVILFGDSTVWSSFSFFSPPYKELLDYLVQIGLTRLDRWNFWMVIIALAMGTVAAFFSGSSRVLAGVAAAVFILAAYPAIANIHGVYESPELGVTAGRILVDTRSSDIDLSTDVRIGSEEDLRTYSAFFALWPRIGLYPEFQKIDYSERDSAESVVIVNPKIQVIDDASLEIEGFVRRGGKVLLMLDGASIDPIPGIGIIEKLGIDLKTEIIPEDWFQPVGPSLSENLLGLPLALLYAPRRQPSNSTLPSAGLRSGLLGVESLLVDKNGLCVFGRRSIGQGELYVFTQSRVFSQYVLGDVWGGVEPDSLRLSLYRHAYQLISQFASKEVSR